MQQVWKGGVLMLLGALVVLGVMLASGHNQAAQARAEAEKGGSPRYTVVETEGHNLLVTDNGTDKLYYYTIDKDAMLGSDLKLRGSIDLKQVGKPVIKIDTVK
jgi:hypothetical protein